MSGAYVAKPAAVVPVDYPPGWNPDWPFPGPLPPGFDWSDYDWEGDGLPAEETDENGDPIPRIWVKPVAGLHTNEHDESWSGEAGAEFWVCLTADPKKGSITVPFVVSDSSIGYCDPTSYTFTSGPINNWGNPRKVKLIGRNDEIIDGDIEYGVIVGPASSTSSTYNGMYGNGGNAVDVTSHEEVNRITVWAVSPAATVGYTPGGAEGEDYVMISVGIFRSDASVSALSAVLGANTVVAFRTAHYHYTGAIEYYGDPQAYASVPLSVSATVDADYKYWVAVWVDIIGSHGSEASSGGRCLFQHDTIDLEDYFFTETIEGTQDFYSYKCFAILDNTATEAVDKLDKATQTVLQDESQTILPTAPSVPE